MSHQKAFESDGILHATINNHRFHLRVKDPMDQNLLWIDGASPPLLLDTIAAEFISLTIEGMWKYQQGIEDKSLLVKNFVVEEMYRKYKTPYKFLKRVTKKRISTDLDRIYGILLDVAEHKCPSKAGLQFKEISMEKWAAPARMDLAITYQCNLSCGHCYMGGSKKIDELTTEQWKTILGKLWKIGIPQCVFTGGEPTLRPDIIELVKSAELFVTGLVTNGTLLNSLAEPLHEASLDYVQVTLLSWNPKTHDALVGSSGAFSKTIKGIKKVISTNIDTVTNTTLVKENVTEFEKTIQFVANELGLKRMSCNSLICSGKGIEARSTSGLSVEELKSVLEKACVIANKEGIQLQFYSPTCYRELNPISLGLGPKTCSAASFNMTIKPDGNVLPCQSWSNTVGNILSDPWNQIWEHPTCNKLRNHGYALERSVCKGCDLIKTCGGGCPLEYMEGTIE